MSSVVKENPTCSRLHPVRIGFVCGWEDIANQLMVKTLTMTTMKVRIGMGQRIALYLNDERSIVLSR